MKKPSVKLSSFFVILTFFTESAFADMDTSTQPFSVRLGESRIIYDPDSNGANLAVTNPQNYPMLVQSTVLEEDKQTRSPFIVTPPLMRLDGKQSSRLRVVRTGGEFASDRETLQWVCVKAIPPKEDDEWAMDKNNKSVKNNSVSVKIRYSINSCIKMFLRPSIIKGDPIDSARNITWGFEGGLLVAKNNSPFYVNLNSIVVGKIRVTNPNFIPPFGEYKITTAKVKRGDTVTWSVVNDYGGESRHFQSELR